MVLFPELLPPTSTFTSATSNPASETLLNRCTRTDFSFITTSYHVQCRPRFRIDSEDSRSPSLFEGVIGFDSRYLSTKRFALLDAITPDMSASILQFRLGLCHVARASFGTNRLRNRQLARLPLCTRLDRTRIGIAQLAPRARILWFGLRLGKVGIHITVVDRKDMKKRDR